MSCSWLSCNQRFHTFGQSQQLRIQWTNQKGWQEYAIGVKRWKSSKNKKQKPSNWVKRHENAYEQNAIGFNFAAGWINPTNEIKYEEKIYKKYRIFQQFTNIKTEQAQYYTGVSRKVVLLKRKSVRSQSIMDNDQGGSWLLDWSSFEVLHRDRRKQHKHLYFCFVLHSSWNTVNLNPATPNYYFASKLMCTLSRFHAFLDSLLALLIRLTDWLVVCCIERSKGWLIRP